LLVLAVIGGAFLWGRRHAPPPAASPTPVAPPVAPVAPPPPPVKPAVLHPIAAASAPAALPALDHSDDYLEKALDELVGPKSVLSFLIVDGLARRFVATVNNLATDGAAADMWPVHRTAGRFDTEARVGGAVISGRNAERYAAFVRFVDGIDTRRAVALYVRLYPLLQHAYEELGFPGQYFNDRVVEVIDHLLATPDLAEPIKVKQVTVDGSARPSGAGLYVFDDPTLEARSAGQKILLRIGVENARRLKSKLRDVRQRIARGALPGGRLGETVSRPR
jgi:hypothetical protein